MHINMILYNIFIILPAYYHEYMSLIMNYAIKDTSRRGVSESEPSDYQRLCSAHYHKQDVVLISL